jgi:hypothetical protein
MKIELKRFLSIEVLVLLVVVCMASCVENAKQDKTDPNETKGSATTNVTDNAKTEMPNEPEKAYN